MLYPSSKQAEFLGCCFIVIKVFSLLLHSPSEASASENGSRWFACLAPGCGADPPTGCWLRATVSPAPSAPARPCFQPATSNQNGYISQNRGKALRLSYISRHINTAYIVPVLSSRSESKSDQAQSTRFSLLSYINLFHCFLHGHLQPV